jgi:hypothetical protein
MKVEDLLFTFDFKRLVAPHLYSEFKGHGSSGQIHVFRFRRVDGSHQPHISYKYWHQSPTWLPADGSTLRILNSRPDLRDAKQVKVSPYVAGAMKDLPALQQKLLHWLRQRQDLGMVPATEIARWKAFFAKIPAVATSTFSFEFPRTGILPVAVASSRS